MLNKREQWSINSMVAAFVAIVVALIFAAWNFATDPYGAQRVLESQGFTEVEVTGYRFFGCGRGDFQHTGFKAKSITGAEVSGVVCSGLMPWGKAYTVRVD